ncbi:OLC1v1032627C1 [Oldenlandia corymbosa var. corymbosa]|uniref:OLC1v1032627C1 n=1 Tax=Oldenlandia corymbosa var. corymbosa TaxID=529605 RepID=A0AAV1CM46_OLDCO|nr:OLC1v1032627C1 [Oldenlandia corymbosa var. corymbosa]
MAAVIAALVVFFALTGYSSADYCLCKDGLSTDAMQTNIDYACGNGANCNPILQNGPCFNPNTVKDHCNWAVNSYFQAKRSLGATCSFQGTAQLSNAPPPTASSGCSYPSSAGSAGGTPSTNNPTTSPPGSTGTPILTPGSPGGSTGTTGSTTGSPNFGGGLAPNGGGGITNPDGGSAALHNNLLASAAATILATGLIFLRV